jgi:hypothetical protein
MINTAACLVRPTYPGAYRWIVVVVGIVFASTCRAVGITWDLRSDWSDTTNPNGAWTYKAGNAVLPRVAQWPLAPPSPPLGGWGVTNLPFWFKSTTSPAGVDWQVGDVVVHTQDDFNGAGNGTANITWTSPLNGAVNITGNAWMAAEIDSIAGGPRGNRWNLYVRNALVSTGTVASGDVYSRANPFLFAAGSGGPGPLANVPVSVGDKITLEVVRTSVDGYFVGTNLTITAVPEPSAVALLGGGAIGFRFVRKRRRRASSQDPADGMIVGLPRPRLRGSYPQERPH